MATVEEPVHFPDNALGDECHVCAFFNSAEEEYRFLLPLIREGIERGEKAFHIIDPRTIEKHRSRLREAGIDVDAAESRGQLLVKRWQDAYLRDGHFDQDGMVALV